MKIESRHYIQLVIFWTNTILTLLRISKYQPLSFILNRIESDSRALHFEHTKCHFEQITSASVSRPCTWTELNSPYFQQNRHFQQTYWTEPYWSIFFETGFWRLEQVEPRYLRCGDISSPRMMSIVKTSEDHERRQTVKIILEIATNEVFWIEAECQFTVKFTKAYPRLE